MMSEPRPAAPAARREDTRDPRASRLAALQLLYAADLREEDPLLILERALRAPDAVSRAHAADRTDQQVSAVGSGSEPDAAEDPASGLDGFAITLVRGVAAGRAQLDERIARLSRGWKLRRMPVIDRNVLRLAIHELLTEPTPVPVVLDEAVRMVSDLSTDDSGRFVNGILAAVVRELPRRADGQDEGPDDAGAVRPQVEDSAAPDSTDTADRDPTSSP
jgi:transcription antitermination protein NusB